MKIQTLIGCLALALGNCMAHADYTFTVNPNAAIPDGNPIGMVSVGTVSGAPSLVSAVTVNLDITGGFNGDLYAYLVAPNQTTTATLLGVLPGGDFTHVGSGYNVTFSDASLVNIQNASQTYGQQLNGTYSSVVPLSVFNGLSANGNWRLFIADLASGGGQARLNSWGLSITTVPVPEPDQVAAMGLLGLLGLAAVSYRRFATRS